MAETISQLERYRAKAIGTNVNAVSLLATDYLNHFNEALMLAELVADMPEMLDDFLMWLPKHYRDHFRESGIADKELAIDAYDVSPPEYRVPFESNVKILNKQLSLLQKSLDSDRDQLQTPEKREFIGAKCSLIRGLIDRIGGIINGQVTEKAAPNKDAQRQTWTGQEKPVEPATPARPQPKPAPEVIEVSGGELLDQSDIDALFD
ncbi:hypothetical protein [Sneathiella aquimaris]|uniref:hypothetical protein n=1 Tax=Sneathiella aquimaris TaxID=2599305 RepID=UPI00146F647F|nr:hypothetical protein [Sneathiella aquimaris]